MANCHVTGPFISANGFVGNLTGNVTLPAGISATTLAVSTTSAFTGVATFTAQPVMSSLTASSAVATDASKGLVSVTNTGTGNNVLATSPVITTPTISAPRQSHTGVAINATAAATGAQAAGGLITTTSAAPTTITLPTGTDLGTVLGAAQGTVLDLFFDNTAGANTLTIAVNTNAILSAMAAAEPTGAGLLTIANGVTGIGCFRLMFASATAYVFSRIA